MNVKYLLGIALAAAATVAACGGGADASKLGNGDDGTGDDGSDPGTNTPGPKQNGGPSGPSTGTGGSTDPSGPTPTNSPKGKDYYIANVYPFMQAGCGGCHVGGVGGAPKWMAADADGSYALMFTNGYVNPTSRIIQKPAHGGSTSNTLTASQKDTFLKWVAMENTDGGTKSQPNVLEKIAGCLDATKFQAIGLQNVRTIQRTQNNNTNNVTTWNENANRCTGCNQAPCRDCHSGDAATGFVMAIGSTQLSPDFTFNETKLTNPAYLQKYFGTDATGKPVASHAIENKMTATSKAPAYSHPYFKLTDAQVAAIDTFVQDAITKYNAGTCTAPPPATP